MNVFIIEGIVGVGKTTLCKKLSEKYNFLFLEEEINDVFKNYIKLCNKDPQKYMLELQYYTLFTTFNKTMLSNKDCFVDTSLYRSIAFLELGYSYGYISKDGYNTFKKYAEFMIKSLNITGKYYTMIYLDAPIEECLKRRNKRSSSSRIKVNDINIKYLTDLNNCYKKVFCDYDIKPYYINYLNFDSKEIENIVERKINENSEYKINLGDNEL